ncbi:L-threonylcarbamoyladenylate synthase [Pararhodonellum marinum]|uniref:L-threonylcarbamoyladenylate synthase n=1 Tax=Pararhodonellum marinum TaxID=2755358 RepID=UPI0018900B9C|nr:L-threonylcarbamoyladenylate synthase [Pararhodonellum marinum]
MAEIGVDIAKAKQILEQGGLVGIPTETVYGLAGNALNPDAVTKIFETKNRPSFDPLIVHTAGKEQVDLFTTDFPEPLAELASAFWPGPLTLLLPRQPIIPDLVTSGLDQVAVRVPQHPLTLDLLQQLTFPLAAPSANPFGYISPTRASHVQDQLGDKIPYILDGGPCTIGLESTIVGMEGKQIVVYRLGGMDLGEIEKIVGKVTVMPYSNSNPKTPGMLQSHYAPTKPLILGNLAEMVEEYLQKGRSFAVLSFQSFFPEVPASLQIALSEKGDLQEAAKNLFAAMRNLDQSEASIILAEVLPERNLGRAINDRLRRAAKA